MELHALPPQQRRSSENLYEAAVLAALKEQDCTPGSVTGWRELARVQMRRCLRKG
jgi:hypothetical protein